MRLRDTVKEIVGRRVERVFARQLEGRQQLYLLFSDGSSIEFWGDFQCSSRIGSMTAQDIRAMFAHDRHPGPTMEFPAP